MKFFGAAVEKTRCPNAQSIWDKLFPICDIICTKSHIRVAHTGLDILGRPVGPPRRPLRMLNAQDRATLEKVLTQVGAAAG